jgi:hypothetical protein
MADMTFRDLASEYSDTVLTYWHFWVKEILQSRKPLIAW